MRRKGELPVPRPLDRWHDGHPVAHAIATGTDWFQAWLAQKCTPYQRLSKLTGIPTVRLITIGQGGPVSRAEMDAFARAWSVSTSDLIASLPDPAIVID